MQRNPSLVGVGGWLACLIAGLAILGPLVGLGQMLEEFDTTEKAFPQLVANAAWLQYKRITWGVFVVTAALSMAAGYRLWKVHVQQSVHFAILALWLVGPVGSIVQMLVTVVSFGSRAMGHVGPKMVMGLLVSSMGAAIWTAYLRRSRRVNNTYAPPPGRAESEPAVARHARRLPARQTPAPQATQCAHCSRRAPETRLQHCMHQHLVCEECLRHCAHCGRAVCVLCDLHHCPRCQRLLCPGCFTVAPVRCRW